MKTHHYASPNLIAKSEWHPARRCDQEVFSAPGRTAWYRGWWFNNEFAPPLLILRQRTELRKMFKEIKEMQHAARV